MGNLARKSRISQVRCAECPEEICPDSATAQHQQIEEDDVKLTPGKLAGMKAVSDKRGVIAAAAMDQRGSLQKALAKKKGSDVNSSMLE